MNKERQFDVCPDPMQDYEGYCLWCECHQCQACDGTGEVHRDNNVDDDLMRECPACGGSGIDPSYTGPDEGGDL